METMSREERASLLLEQMDARFGRKEEPALYRAPGRVDLMGSHTDYNEGFILAATVDRDVMAAALPRDDKVMNLYSLNLDSEVSVHTAHLVYDPRHGWANYVKGVAFELMELGVRFTGMDLAVHGAVPVGGNLSSSAALESVACEAVLGVSGGDIPAWEKVQAAWRAETAFVGMPCGIMDQFTVIMGEEKTALFLDCRTLKFEKISFELEGASLLVIDSGTGRDLVSSGYAQRVKECGEAAAVLAARDENIKALRDASLDQVESAKAELGDALYRRARHVVTENQRVRKAADALKAGDPETLGKVMEQGYESCRDDYENSTPQLDQLHDLVSQRRGVYGVRIAGAGWGGSLLALMEDDRACEAAGSALEEYRELTGNQGRYWKVKPSKGAGPA